jgi:hypothetical protein
MATTHDDDARYNKAIGVQARGLSGKGKGKFLLGSMLDRFNYTYHLRFTMLNPIESIKMDPSLGVVMVESATTSRYIIDSFELTQTVGWDKVTRSAFGGRGTLVITESGGASYLDSMLRAATLLKIPDYKEATYLMEVSFPTESPSDPMLPTYKWLFKITGMAVNVSTAGAQYSIQIIDVSQHAISSTVAIINDVLVLDKLETFGDFVDTLEKELNDAQQKKVKVTQMVANEYEFIYPKSWKSWKLENLDAPDENDPFMRSTNDNTKIQCKVTKGTNILDLTGFAVGNTAEFQGWVSDKSSSGEATDRDKTDETKLDTIKKFYRIQTDVEYLKYDVLRGEYAQKLTYKIMSYLEPRLDTGMAKTYVPNIGNAQQAKTRVDKMRKAGLLKKVYAHSGTGINTNVLNFDCTMNHSYYSLQPVFNSASIAQIPGYKFEQGGKHKQNKLLDDIKKIDSKIEKLQSAANAESSPGVIGSSIAKSQEDSVKQRNQKMDELVSTPSVNDEPSVPAPTSNKGRMTGLTYAESFQDEEEYLNPNSFPIKFIEDANMATNMEAFPGGSHRGRAFFNTTYLNLSNNADFAKIDLHIKGDPYWFGSPNSIRDNDWHDEETGIYANYELGSCAFFFTMNFPSTSLASRDSNSQYGSPSETDMASRGVSNPTHQGTASSMLTGKAMANNDTSSKGLTSPEPWVQEANGLEAVYLVTNIISNFSNGQFTQHLYGLRDCTINISLVYDELKGDIDLVKQHQDF